MWRWGDRERPYILIAFSLAGSYFGTHSPELLGGAMGFNLPVTTEELVEELQAAQRKVAELEGRLASQEPTGNVQSVLYNPQDRINLVPVGVFETDACGDCLYVNGA
jgi:hypothetical protein